VGHLTQEERQKRREEEKRRTKTDDERKKRTKRKNIPFSSLSDLPSASSAFTKVVFPLRNIHKTHTRDRKRVGKEYKKKKPQREKRREEKRSEEKRSLRVFESDNTEL
jgi:hypothetical protein